MKKHFSIYFATLLSIFFAASAIAQENYVITGQLNGSNETHRVYLKIENKLIDSAEIQQGHFKLTGKIPEPKECLIWIKGKKGWVSFIIENGIQYTLEGKVDSLSTSTISGSKEIELSKELRAMLKPVLQEIRLYADSMSLAKDRHDTIAYNRYLKMHLEHRFHMGDLRKAFILQHNDSYTSLFNFEELRFSFGLTEQKKIFAALSPTLKNHTAWQIQYDRMYAGR